MRSIGLLVLMAAASDAAMSTRRPIDLIRHLLARASFEAPHPLRYRLESFRAQGLPFPGSDARNALTLERFQGGELRRGDEQCRKTSGQLVRSPDSWG